MYDLMFITFLIDFVLVLNMIRQVQFWQLIFSQPIIVIWPTYLSMITNKVGIELYSSYV